jgi:hypothetical protein
MRAYVGHVGCAGLRRFVAEDAVPAAVLSELICEWTAATATVVLAVVPDDGAEEICRKLVAEQSDAACAALPIRAAELIPLRPAFGLRKPLS